MKCQKCERPALVHITDLVGGKVIEKHLCPEHAKEYLSQPAGESSASSGLAAALAQQLAQKMQAGQASAELAELDQQTCPVCGISFYEFRSQGRLGCPNDYNCFWEQLQPLVANIHGEVQHVGKRPQRSPRGAERRMQLIRLRREIKEAVAEEDYERASRLRDQIQRIECDSV